MSHTVRPNWPKADQNLVKFSQKVKKLYNFRILNPILLKFNVDAQNGVSLQINAITKDLSDAVTLNWPKTGQNWSNLARQ